MYFSIPTHTEPDLPKAPGSPSSEALRLTSVPVETQGKAKLPSNAMGGPTTGESKSPSILPGNA
jgi:hypothetical protein